MKRFTFGWGIVVTCFMLAFVNGVFNLQVANFLINPVQQEMVWPRSSVMLLLLIQNFVYMISAFGIGFLIDKMGAKPVVVISSLCLWISFMILSKIQNFAPFLIYFSIFAGIGAAGIGNAVIYTVIGKWFRARRGMILAFTLLGASFSVAALQPIIEAMAESGAGWRSYWFGFSFLPLICLIPLSVIFLGRKPADRGYNPFFSEHRFLCDEDHKDPVDSYTLPQVLKMPSFWLILSSWLFSSFAGKTVHMIAFPFATEKGIAVSQFPGFFAVIFICIPIGVVLFGILSDFLSARILAAVLCAVQAAALLLFAVFGSDFLFYGAMGAVCALTVGGLFSVMPLLMIKYFGPDHLGKIAGLMTAVCGFADLADCIYMGVFHETLDSSVGVMTVAVLSLVVAAVAVGLAKRPNRKAAE